MVARLAEGDESSRRRERESAELPSDFSDGGKRRCGGRVERGVLVDIPEEMGEAARTSQRESRRTSSFAALSLFDPVEPTQWHC